MGKLFGTDGIRGEANRHPMDAPMAYQVGLAVTHMFKKEGHRPKVVIGKDTRVSVYMLESALEAGICAMGGHANLLGVLPTPGVAFMVQSQRADAGIVISASHNPFQDNGIKIFARSGYKLPDGVEEEMEDLILNDRLEAPSPRGEEDGPGLPHRRRDRTLHGLSEKRVPPRSLDGGDEDRPGHGPRRHVQGRAADVLGAGRRRRDDPPRAQRLQHQRRLRLPAYAGPGEARRRDGRGHGPGRSTGTATG